MVESISQAPFETPRAAEGWLRETAEKRDGPEGARNGVVDAYNDAVSRAQYREPVGGSEPSFQNPFSAARKTPEHVPGPP